MNDKYICNDDGVLEEVIAIKNMSEDEFEAYIEQLKASEKEQDCQ